MHIVDMLKIEYIIGDLESKNKREVLQEIPKVFLIDHSHMDIDRMTAILLDRENLGSTGIGEGIALPHGKMPGLDETLISFGRSHDGISFDSLDGKPAHLFFLVMAPENSTGIHLKLLARLSKMLKDSEFRKRLLEARTKGEIFASIAQKDAALQA